MKTIILILILFSSKTFAQTTLTSANNPAAGNIDHYATCDTTNISQGNAGTNQTWNFTNLTRQDSTTVTFVAASTTPYTAQFPTSNIASTNDNTYFNYGTTSGNNYLVNGNAGPNLVIPYSDPQLFMQYPFTYNNSFNDNFAANYTVQGIPVVMTGTTTVSGDAWGTITLPNGSFSNALRVKYLTVTKDSSSFVSILTLTSYVWFVPGKKFPVFEIIYTSITFNGVPFGSSKTVNYSTNQTIGIQNISTEIPENYLLSQNYPNPFNPATNLEFAITKPGLVSLKIYNMLGEEVETLVNTNLTPGTYKYNFDASALTSGVYFYKLTAGEFTETKKMNLVK